MEMPDSCVLDIVRQSIGFLCSSCLPTLLFITLLLIFPVSSITLSQVITNTHLGSQLSALLACHLAHTGVPLSPFSRLFYTQLSQTLVSHAMSFPVTLTLWMLAKSTIFYIMACRERGKDASVMGLLEKGPRTWSRVAATYVWGCFAVVLVTAMLVVLEVTGAMLLQLVAGRLEYMKGLESSVHAIFDVGMASMYAMVLAPMVIILNLGSVVAGMEESKCGRIAFLRVLSLLKRRGLRPPLLLFLITGIAITGIEGAFQYRVLGRAMPPASPHPSSILEAPFLIFAHSFILLLDTIMSVSFYRTCQMEVDAVSCVGRKSKHREEEEDHFSIVVHIVEQQFRKMMFAGTTRPI